MHEAMSDWAEVVAAEYRRAVGEADPEAGINRQFAFEAAAARLRSLVDNGELNIQFDEVINHHIRASLKEADKVDGRSADKVLARLVNGETAVYIEDDPFLDTVVTLGDGLRKQWRHVGPEDLFSMYEIRAENMRRQEEAFKSFTENIKAMHRAIVGFNTVGEAWEAGRFTQANAA